MSCWGRSPFEVAQVSFELRSKSQSSRGSYCHGNILTGDIICIVLLHKYNNICQSCDCHVTYHIMINILYGSRRDVGSLMCVRMYSLYLYSTFNMYHIAEGFCGFHG